MRGGITAEAGGEAYCTKVSINTFVQLPGDPHEAKVSLKARRAAQAEVKEE